MSIRTITLETGENSVVKLKQKIALHEDNSVTISTYFPDGDGSHIIGFSSAAEVDKYLKTLRESLMALLADKC